MYALAWYNTGMTNRAKRVRWKVGLLIASRGHTPYALSKASGLSLKATYAITNGKAEQAKFTTLAALLAGLETLTGDRFTVCDVLDIEGGRDDG